MRQVSDLNIASNIPLPAPALMLHEIPRTEAQEEFVAQARRQIRDIILHKDPRLLLIVGPCSIHDTRAGLEYATRLRGLIDRVGEKIMIVMRCYFEKPRTSLGWKGLIMDPHLDGSDDIPEGLRTARRFLGDVLEKGVPTATELLDPITPQYIADLICWSAVGARTTESQTHRQMASGLSMPLGFKNATSGAVAPALNEERDLRGGRPGVERHPGRAPSPDLLRDQRRRRGLRRNHPRQPGLPPRPARRRARAELLGRARGRGGATARRGRPR
jgi:3-deoxy-7-phosphoheptulonate synthase